MNHDENLPASAGPNPAPAAADLTKNQHVAGQLPVEKAGPEVPGKPSFILVGACVLSVLALVVAIGALIWVLYHEGEKDSKGVVAGKVKEVNVKENGLTITLANGEDRNFLVDQNTEFYCSPDGDHRTGPAGLKDDCLKKGHAIKVVAGTDGKTAVNVHVPEHDAGPGKAFLLALLFLVFGLVLLVWLSHLLRAFKWPLLDHISHEVGMAFFIGGLVLGAVELTTRVAEERAREAFLTAEQKSRQGFREDLRAERDITDEVSGLVDHVLKEQEQPLTDPDYFNALRKIKGLANKPHIGERLRDKLTEWNTRLLNRYGLFLSAKGKYVEALKELKKAKEIDEQRAKENPASYELSGYVPYTYGQLANVYFKKGALEEAKTSLVQAVRLWEDLARQFKDDPRYADQGKLYLAREMKFLEELKVTKLLKFKEVIEAEDSLEKEDLAGFSVDGRPYEKEKVKIYAIELKKDKQYEITLVTSREGLAKDLDPYLVLEDGLGRTAAKDDDGLGNFDSRIVFDCPRDGFFRIIAASAPNAGERHPAKTGKFALKIQERKK
jgi:tetratricopeptide (TPR) repeat protein